MKGVATFAGVAALYAYDMKSAAAGPPPETRAIRLKEEPFPCEAPGLVAQELLRAEGLSEVQYVPGANGVAAVYDQLASGKIDLALDAAWNAVQRIDTGAHFVLLLVSMWAASRGKEEKKDLVAFLRVL